MPLLASVACSGGAGGDAEFTLRVADSKSKQHYVVRGATVPWMDCIERGTGGRVVFEFYPAEQLGELPDHLSLLRDGVADVAYVPPAFFEGAMPLSQVHTIPGLFTDSTEASKIFDEASEETRIAEVDYARNGIKYLWGAMTVPSEIYTSDKPIKSLRDIQGLTLRGSGGTLQAAVKRMGATTLTLPTTEVYQAVQTGTADGTIMATASVESYSINEVTNYATDGMHLGTFWMPYAIATDVWERLPEDIKAVFKKCNDEAVVAGAKAATAATAKARKKFESAGMTYTSLPKGDIKKIKRIYDSVAQNWATQNSANGGAEVLKFIRKRLGANGGATR